MWYKTVGLIIGCLLLNGCCFVGSCIPPKIEIIQQQEGVIESIVKQDTQVYFVTNQGTYVSKDTAEYDEINAFPKAFYLEDSLVLTEQGKPNHQTITHLIYLDAMKTGKTIQMDEFGRKTLILNEQKPWTNLSVWTYQDFAEDTISQNARVRFPHELTDIATSRAEQKIRLDKDRPKLIALKIVHYHVTKRDSSNQLTLTKENQNKPISTSFVDWKPIQNH
ncbi:hypothetical protein [Pasteurella sp. PK-2025]|uniref:hypothetical protein n=1 Tax=Pasteurella sp. PK-2025 TaxID=3413133 RepID=UPI003C717047